MNYSLEDIWLIKHALKEKDPWSSNYITKLKAKIKNHLREKQKERCCYCYKNMHGEFNLTIDIEHILPKSKFKNVIFDLMNLAVSCKRCNMKIKRDKIDFISNFSYIQNLNPIDKSNYFRSENYIFIHPNLDNFTDHINYKSIDIGEIKFVKYTYKSDKGHYTYNYFRLDELEINELDQSQGITPIDENSDDEIVDLFKRITSNNSTLCT